jgi:hypothetical protein
MRHFALSLILSVAVLMPNIGNAQLIQPTPPPQVTAANASWQINGEPIFFSGQFYYPAGPTVYFDGNVMVRSGVYESVPLYSDTTLEPNSIVFVPVGGKVMRPYERKRDGQLAGTVGSRAPAFPIQRDVEVSLAAGKTGIQTPPMSAGEPVAIAEAARPVGTVGTIVPRAVGSAPAASAERARPRRTAVESIPAPRSNAGIWIEFDGARWRSAGAAVSYRPDRFTPIGEYHGFPVYRNTSGKTDQIFVAAVQDGPLVPYKR